MTAVVLGAFLWFALSAYFKPISNTSESSRGVLSLWSAAMFWVLAVLLLSSLLRFTDAIELGARLPVALLVLVLLFPFAVLRFVTMPLGLPRLSYLLAILCVVRFSEDHRGGAALMGALTLLRARPRTGEAAMRFLEARIAEVKHLGAAGLCAQALLYARRGDHDGARALLLSLAELDRRVVPPWAAALASDYLAADALARGDWPELRRLSDQADPRPPLTELLGAVAAAVAPLPPETETKARTEPPARPGRASLYRAFLGASYHRQTWPLLQAALRALDRPRAPAPAAKRPDPEAPSLAGALGELRHLLSTETSRLTIEDFRRTGVALERALGDPQTQQKALVRGLALGAGAAGGQSVSGEAALSAVRADAVKALAARLRETRYPFGALSGPSDAGGAARPTVLGEATQLLRGELLAEVENATSALHNRTQDKRALPRLDEWREWSRLRTLYLRTGEMGGMPARHLAWTAFHREVCNWAVWLWNVRSEKILGNTVFRFLLNEAEALDDERSASLAKKNVGCGIGL